MTRQRFWYWTTSTLLLGLLAGLFIVADSEKPSARRQAVPVKSPESMSSDRAPSPPGDALLEGYGDPATAPIEDLRKIQRVVSGYYSVIKDASRFPIGGNGDLAAALRGENPNREVFVSASNRVFAGSGLLVDRWESPVIVHPEAWREIELRSAGPDKVPYSGDDLILRPNGSSVAPR